MTQSAILQGLRNFLGRTIVNAYHIYLKEGDGSYWLDHTIILEWENGEKYQFPAEREGLAIFPIGG